MSLVNTCNALFHDDRVLGEEGASTAVEFRRRINVHINGPGSRKVEIQTGKTYFVRVI